MERERPIALILGGSSGLGLATAKKMAKEGFDLFVVHRDRRTALEAIERDFTQIRRMGAQLATLNADATQIKKQEQCISEFQRAYGQRKVKVLVHSIAKGNLKPMVSSKSQELDTRDFELTIHAMALSLYGWVKLLATEGLFAEDARVIGFTSEGSSKVLPNYGAVSAAKAAMEAIIRNIALEFAPFGLKANAIQAGITDTPSLRMIPNSDMLKTEAVKRNPQGRLTTPEDVANVAYLLTTEEAGWITGTVIKVDGGESLQ